MTIMKLKLLLMCLAYLLADLVRYPRRSRSLLRTLQKQKDRTENKAMGWVDFLLLTYLPQRYLRRTKYVHYASSPSIIKKLAVVYGNYPKQAPSQAEVCPTSELTLTLKPKILIIRKNAMGDVILTTPAIREMYEDRGGFCEIYVATDFPALFELNPYVKQAFKIEELSFTGCQFDHIIDLDMAYERNKNTHVVDVYGFYCSGRPPRNPQPFIASSDLRLENLPSLQSHGNEADNIRTIVVHNRKDPTQPYRGLNPGIWTEIMNDIPRIASEATDEISIKIYTIGTRPFDMHVDNTCSYDLRDSLSVRDTKTLIEKSDLFIGIDAGPLHLAASTDTPIVALYTHVNPEFYSPRRTSSQLKIKNFAANIECSGCASRYPIPWGFHCERGDFACTGRFSKSAIMSTIEKLLLND